MSFSAHPEIAALNDRIQGNGALPALSDRLPAEPLVVIPYDSVGKYGETLDVFSNATEAGTSDFLSVRHVNLVPNAGHWVQQEQPEAVVKTLTDFLSDFAG